MLELNEMKRTKCGGDDAEKGDEIGTSHWMV